MATTGLEITINDSIRVLDEEDRYLAEIPEARLQAVFAAPDGLIPIVEAIEQLVRQFIPDMSTAKGRAEVRSLAHKVTRSKTFLDDLGKGLVADLKDLPKRIDANRKTMRDRLESLAAEARQPLTDYEERIEEFQNRLKMLADMPVQYTHSSSAEIKRGIDKLADMPTSAAQWEEFQPQAEELKTRTLQTLGDMHRAKWQSEQEAAELARLRAESAVRDHQNAIRKAQEDARAQADARAKQEREAAAYREEQAKLQAEVDRKRAVEAEARLAEAKRLSEERERKHAEEVKAASERAAADAKAADEAAEAKRKADHEHFRTINSEVAADLEKVIEAAAYAGDVTNIALARSITIAIVKRQVRHTTITY
jgi:hypothetical protein